MSYATPELRRAALKKWKLENPDKVKAHQKKYCAKNAESLRAAVKLWCINNPDKRRNIERRKETKERIADQIGISVHDVPVELLNAKIAILDVKRKLKELSNEKSQ